MDGNGERDQGDRDRRGGDREVDGAMPGLARLWMHTFSVHVDGRFGHVA
jgi:hypothetical protein